LRLLPVFTLLGGCVVFQKKDKYGCPANGSAIGAEKLAAGDEEAVKRSEKAKYRGGRKSY
jgi:hypothetical protein